MRKLQNSYHVSIEVGKLKKRFKIAFEMRNRAQKTTVLTQPEICRTHLSLEGQGWLFLGLVSEMNKDETSSQAGRYVKSECMKCAGLIDLRRYNECMANRYKHVALYQR